MKMKLKIFFYFFCYSLLILGISNAYAQRSLTRSFDVVLIGKFINPDKKGNSKTYELSHGEEKMRFTVTTKPHILSPTSITGWTLLSKIRPRRINLLGNVEVIKPLKQPETVGKNMELRGQLYLNNRTFFLKSVKEIWRKNLPDSRKGYKK